MLVNRPIIFLFEESIKLVGFEVNLIEVLRKNTKSSGFILLIFHRLPWWALFQQWEESLLFLFTKPLLCVGDTERKGTQGPHCRDTLFPECVNILGRCLGRWTRVDHWQTPLPSGFPLGSTSGGRSEWGRRSTSSDLCFSVSAALPHSPLGLQVLVTTSFLSMTFWA